MARKNNGVLSFLLGFLFVVLAFGGLASVFARLDTCEHEWDDGVVKTEATCTSAGRIEYECELCGETKTKKLPLLEHIVVVEETAVEPTCTTPGWTESSYCEVCNTVLSIREEIPVSACVDNDEDGFCDWCDSLSSLSVFVSNADNYTIESVEVGELAVGNVYRVYYDYIPNRPSSMPSGILCPSKLIFSSNIGFNLSYSGSAEFRYLFYESMPSTGFADLYPEEYMVLGEDENGYYVDYLIVEGLSFSLKTTFDDTLTVFTFDSALTVKSFTEGGVYRLERKAE